MTYSNFTLETVRKAFQLELVERAGFHLQRVSVVNLWFQLELVERAGIFTEIEPVEPSAHLTTSRGKKVPIATTINTEKARSELIVADILVELHERFENLITFFSGIDFNVDAEKGLTGTCDFLVSLSPIQSFLEAPVIALVEAKRENLTVGLGQCAAEMLAAQQFNAENDNNIPIIYGATTSGTEWKFLKLKGQRLHIDKTFYSIERCDKILGILSHMVTQNA